MCCWGQGRQITFVLCRACPGSACLPGALLTGESSSSADFQAGDSPMQIAPLPSSALSPHACWIQSTATPSSSKSLPSTARACAVVIRRYEILIYIAERVIYTLM